MWREHFEGFFKFLDYSAVVSAFFGRIIEVVESQVMLVHIDDVWSSCS